MTDPAFAKALDIWKMSKKSRWKPYPKQKRAAELASKCFELLYGGAAGGGKSMFLRCYGVDKCVDQPGSHIAIVRRSLPMLKQTHGLHLDSLVGDLGKPNRTDYTWTFTNGSVLRFISLANEGDEQNYKSVEFDLLLFDEVTELSESQYTYMLSRVRSARGYRAHSIATANPEGRGYRWVKNRFVSPPRSDLGPGDEMPTAGQSWSPPLMENGLVIDRQPPRAFLPATVFDNPGLLESNPTYIQQLKSLPDSRLRRALLDGDWTAMDQIPGALWNHTLIDEHRIQSQPELLRIVIGVDPTGSSSAGADECGIVAAGLGADGRYYVMRDYSAVASPSQWAGRVVTLYDELSADKIVLERNFGGDMVESNLRNIRKSLPIKMVTASRGKALRAEPIAALYEQGKVSHVGRLMELEDQLCTWTQMSGWSPDRLDALVWCMTELSTGSGLLGYLNSISKMCPACNSPNLSKAKQCFKCNAELPEVA
jgi:hypothetical protein